LKIVCDTAAIKQSNYMKRKLEKVPVTIVQTNSQSTNPISSTPSSSQDAIDLTQLLFSICLNEILYNFVIIFRLKKQNI
jgi:hypothetical protein